MTVDGSDERPLALRDLAQADSPEIVRAALGKFRRRLFMRGLILVLIVATGFVLYPRYFRDTGDLTSEIQHSRGVSLYNTVKAGTTEATIFRVARLGREAIASDGPVERFGIHLLVTSVPFAAPEQNQPDHQIVPLLRSDLDRGVLSIRTESNSNIAIGFEMWVSLVAGTQTIDIPIAGVVLNGDSTRATTSTLGTLHIDMKQLGVPDWTWR
jgi:hypothetical protein